MNEELNETRRIHILLKKYKGLKGKLELAKFEQPVLMLMRRGNRVEFYEGIKQGVYDFQHSEGDERQLILQPGKLQTIEYGANTFVGYIAHEDDFLPYPQEPLIDGESFKITVCKIIADIKTWKEKEIKAWGNFIWKVLGGVALIVGIYFAYKWLGGSGEITKIITQEPQKTIEQGVEQVATVITSAIGIWRTKWRKKNKRK